MKKILAGIIVFGILGILVYMFPGFFILCLGGIALYLAIGAISNIFYWAVETLFG